MMDLLKCDICGSTTKVLGCGASRVGPFSCMMCQTCLENNAEMEFAFIYLKEELGDQVQPFIFDLTTYMDGKYISYRNYLARPAGDVVS